MSIIRLSIIRRLSMALLLSMVLMLLSAAPRAVPSAEAAPTAAVSGVVLVVDETVHDSRTPKTLPVDCPPGKRVIGGGGGAFEFADVDARGTNPALTELRPLSFYDGVTTRDSYIASATETPPGTTNDWWITAYAMCADPLPGLNIVSASTTFSSKAIQATPVSCGGGVVIGTGASVSTKTGNVVLQVARPSGSGDSARAQGHEVAASYRYANARAVENTPTSLNWDFIVATAVCAY